MPFPVDGAAAHRASGPVVRAAVCAVACLLAACTTVRGPLPTPPPQPSAWSVAGAQGEPTRLTHWWDRFGDPALGALVRRALESATDIDAAEARLRQARAQRDVTAGGTLPSVTASGSAQASAGEHRATTRSVQLGLDASWEPDLWGGTRAAVAAADASVRASGASLAATRLAVAAETALAVLQWRGVQARLAIARDNLASQRQTLQIVQWRREAGLVTDLDVQQARTAVAQTEAQVPALQTQAAQLLNALAVLTGGPPGSVAVTSAPQPSAPPSLTLAMPADVLRQRPDVAAAEARVAAAGAAVAQAQAERLPQLRLGGSIGLAALDLAGLGNGAGVASLAASISLPVFDAGRGAARVQLQQAAFDESQAGYRAAVLAALQDVEDNLVAIAGTREQIASQRTAADAARAAARLAGQRYASGLVDFPNVLQSQRTLLAAEDALAASTTTLNLLHVRLYKALGGGWLPDEGEAAAGSAQGPQR